MTSTSIHASSRRRNRSRSDTQAASRTTERLGLLLAVAICLPLLYTGTSLLFAGIASHQASAFLSDWERKGEEPGERAWQIARDAAQRAIDLYPVANGAYQHRLGLIEQWQQFRQPFGEPKAEASRRAALQAFRAATEARPTWPEHWSALAYAKLYLLEFDAEFHSALQRAHELGPWRIAINRRIAEIGFTAWPQLNASERERILESARRTAAYSTQEAQNLLAIAKRAGMTDELCDSLNSASKDTRKICH
ncbi:conserved hypothetical protein [Pseudomonas sp. OF001]|uniref:hypothetical protein n=1 Tax=Pseudomonas sp. OF001 TaxID=2772300 RepID=UPI00191B6827|nr:hypothetical protein [Pseudomonas sp. OF001]CAD5377021.1 conserved hypothetical protein [Pseudomonas sp. OF001]